jgi:hypothetical protein
VRQLGQALLDFEADKPIRAVDDSGNTKPLDDGAGDLTVTDVYLRYEFPPPGKVRAKRTGNTPAEIFQDRLAKVSDAMEELERAHTALAAVQGDDGRSLAETDGVNPQLCAEWRETLGKVVEDLTVWVANSAIATARALR